MGDVGRDLDNRPVDPHPNAERLVANRPSDLDAAHAELRVELADGGVAPEALARLYESAGFRTTAISLTYRKILD